MTPKVVRDIEDWMITQRMSLELRDIFEDATSKFLKIAQDTPPVGLGFTMQNWLDCSYSRAHWDKLVAIGILQEQAGKKLHEQPLFKFSPDFALRIPALMNRTAADDAELHKERFEQAAQQVTQWGSW